MTGTSMSAEKVVSIGGDRQLFVDDLLVETLQGVCFKLHEPIPREIVIYFDQPWEGETSWCPVVLGDEDGHGPRYRTWYRAQNTDEKDGKTTLHCFTAYAESEDGVTWHRPSLGLVAFQGSTDNNICIHNPNMKNVAVFRDERPGVPEEERYKAVGRWMRGKPSRIYGMVSGDGVHWRMAQEGPLIVAPENDGQFDSPINGFWDARRGRYVVYARGMSPNGPGHRIRAIRMSTSPDFVHWEPLQYVRINDDVPWREHLYTNSAHPYYRAPYVLMFPKRFLPDRTFSRDWGHNGQSDVLFMASRDGVHFRQLFREAFLRPGLDRRNWHERSIIIAPWTMPSGEGEMSFYSVENFRTDTVHMRRYTLREDGFVSAHAGDEGGELLTRPFIPEGNRLEINYATSAAGLIRVEVLDAAGGAIPGYEAGACGEIFGDEIMRVVEWGGEADVGALSGKAIRLRFEIKDADLYSFRFFG